MDESTVLDILERVANRVDAIAGMILGICMLVVSALIYIIFIYYKEG